MVRNEDDQSFPSLTLNELLHPETAVSSTSQSHSDQSPWATVYFEAVSGSVDYDSMPVATDVVPIHDVETANPQQPQEAPSPQRVSQDSHTPQPPSLPKVQPWQHSNVIDLILGFTLTVAAFMCTIKIEITAIIIYTLAAGLHYLAEEVFNGPGGVLGRTLCLFLSAVLMVVDPILLTVSLLVTELIGGLALLLCTIFGGSRSGSAWHQFIRKICHLSRWGFRRCHTGWKPERIFPFTMEDEQSHLHTAVPCEDPHDDMNGSEMPTRSVMYGGTRSSHSSCSCCHSAACTSCTHTTEDSTLISDLTTVPYQDDVECPPITISPENVAVIHDDTQHQDEVDEDPLFKNIQQVVMT